MSSRAVAASPGRTSANTDSTDSTTPLRPPAGSSIGTEVAMCSPLKQSRELPLEPIAPGSGERHGLLDRAECTVERSQSVPDVVLADDQGWRQPQHIVVEAAAPDENAVVLHELHDAHDLSGRRLP